MAKPQDRMTWTPDQVDLIKRTVAKDCTNDEFKLFLYQAARTGLDPLAKQIYAVKRGGRMTIQTGIDGFRLTADRTGKLAGSDDAVFTGKPKQPDFAASVTVYKIIKGVRCPFSATARWAEYYPGDAQGAMWNKMPCTMLAKCAEALALRKAFPADLSGVYTKEEMDQAEVVDAPPVARRIEPAPATIETPSREPGEDDDDETPLATQEEDRSPVITQKQRKYLFGKAKDLGYDEGGVRRAIVHITGQESTANLTENQMSAVVSMLEEAARAVEQER